jgi:hypothetical protein
MILCALMCHEKLILQPSPLKIHAERLRFIERIQGDICGPYNHYVVFLDTSWF